MRSRYLPRVIGLRSGRARLIPGSDLKGGIFYYYTKDWSAGQTRVGRKEDGFQERSGRIRDHQPGSEG